MSDDGGGNVAPAVRLTMRDAGGRELLAARADYALLAADPTLRRVLGALDDRFAASDPTGFRAVLRIEDAPPFSVYWRPASGVAEVWRPGEPPVTLRLGDTRPSPAPVPGVVGRRPTLDPDDGGGVHAAAVDVVGVCGGDSVGCPAAPGVGLQTMCLCVVASFFRQRGSPLAWADGRRRRRGTTRPVAGSVGSGRPTLRRL